MANQSLGLIGLSYKAAPVEIREQVVLLPQQQLSFYDDARTSLDGLAILSTCNRVEFYGHVNDRPECAMDALGSLLDRSFDLGPAQSYLYYRQSNDVSHHLMRVACGLDSMILGESQILGQVHDSLLSSESASLASVELRTVFKAAVKAGKRARAETALGKFPVSIASVAIEHILLKAGQLQNLHVAVIGAGEMGSLASKILQKKTIARLTFVNRNHERARALAVDACAHAVPIEELRDAVSQADVVISATDAPHIILSPEHIAHRKDRPLLLVDLAVPRDIDPFLGELPNVTLLDIDHLKNDIVQSKAARQAEVPQVEKIIEKELSLLEQRLTTLKIEPVITDLRHKAESIRQTELSRTLEILGPLDPQVVARLENFSSSLVKKILHEPTLNLRQGTSGLNPDTVRHLFGLQDSALNK